MSVSFSGLAAVIMLALFYVQIRRLELLLIASIFFYTTGLLNFGSFGIGVDRMILLAITTGIVLRAIQIGRISFPVAVWVSLTVLLVIAIVQIALIQQVTVHALDGVLFSETKPILNKGFYIKFLEFCFAAVSLGTIKYLFSQAQAKRYADAISHLCFLICCTGFLDLLIDTSSLWAVIKNHDSYPTIVGRVTGILGEARVSGLTVEPSHYAVFAGAGLILTLRTYSKSAKSLIRVCFFSLSLLLSFSVSVVFFVVGAALFLNWQTRSNAIKKAIFVFVCSAIGFILWSLVADVFVGNFLHKVNFSNPEEALRIISIVEGFRSLSYFWPIGIGLGNYLLPSGLLVLLPITIGVFAGAAVLIFYGTSYVKLTRRFQNIDEQALLCVSLSIFAMCLFTKGYQFFLMPYLFLFVHIPLFWKTL